MLCKFMRYLLNFVAAGIGRARPPRQESDAERKRQRCLANVESECERCRRSRSEWESEYGQKTRQERTKGRLELVNGLRTGACECLCGSDHLSDVVRAGVMPRTEEFVWQARG